jgi:hypothetical protein
VSKVQPGLRMNGNGNRNELFNHLKAGTLTSGSVKSPTPASDIQSQMSCALRQFGARSTRIVLCVYDHRTDTIRHRRPGQDGIQ